MEGRQRAEFRPLEASVGPAPVSQSVGQWAEALFLGLPITLNLSCPESKPVTTSSVVHFWSLQLLFPPSSGLLTSRLQSCMARGAVHHAHVQAGISTTNCCVLSARSFCPVPTDLPLLTEQIHLPSLVWQPLVMRPSLPQFHFCLSFPPTDLFSQPQPLAFIFPGTYHAHSRLRAFAHAVPSVRNTLPGWSTWHPSSTAQLYSCQPPSLNRTPTRHWTRSLEPPEH